MRTIDYLNEAAKRVGAKTDAELARALNMNRSTVCRYLKGERVMDDYTAARVAELLGIEPLQVIAAANAERETDQGKKQFWEKFARAAVIAAAVVGGAQVASMLDLAQPGDLALLGSTINLSTDYAQLRSLLRRIVAAARNSFAVLLPRCGFAGS